MKIKNALNASPKYITASEVSVGDVFRLIGEKDLIFSAEELYCYLETGETVFIDDEAPVEIVEGSFEVERIISMSKEY